MTDFFERQNIAKRKTQLLLFYYLPAVALTIGAIYFVFAKIFGSHQFNATLFLAVSEVTLIIIIGGSLIKSWELRQGGSAVATMLGGHAVPLQPTDPDEKKFRDVVEEMSIASGVP